MSAFLERLRAIHRECGSNNASMTPRVGRSFSLPSLPAQSANDVMPQDRIVVPLAEVERRGQACLTGSLRIDPGTHHGELAVGEVLNLSGRAAFMMSGDERLRDFDVTQAAFFDLETTGLMGGSGNLAFLAGLVRVERGGSVVVHQVLLRHPAEEPAALALIEELLEPVEFLVSFNGKAFDRNVLADRFVMNRLDPSPVLEMPHLDLLHPARRIYRGHLGACNLSSIEVGCLGVRRPDTEVSGADVPGRWFEFLHSGRLPLLQPVISHNLLDLLSLLTLAARLADLLAGRDLEAVPVTIQVAVARMMVLRGEADHGETVLRRIASGDPRDPVIYSALGLLADHLRKTSRHTESIGFWSRMIEAVGAEDLAPWEGLAIALEHRLGRPREALDLVDRLLDCLRRDGTIADEGRGLTHRRARLARKAAGAQSGQALVLDRGTVDCVE